MKRFQNAYILTVLFIISSAVLGCRSNPRVPENMVDVPYTEGELFSRKNPNAGIQYILTNSENNQSGDFIIFLHGASWDHRQWLKTGGIYDQYLQACRIAGTEPLPAASLHFAPYYFIVDGAKIPLHSDDLYTFYRTEVIPFLRETLDCSGRIYLIGYSMGGHNALSISVFEPELYSRVFLVSPMLVPDSPFEANFINDMVAVTGRLQMAKGFKQMMIDVYQTPENWQAHDAFVRFYDFPEEYFPFYYLTVTEADMEGFQHTAKELRDVMIQAGLPHEFYIAGGTHTDPEILDPLVSFVRGIEADQASGGEY